MSELPENIQLEFLHPDVRPVLFKELGAAFLTANAIATERADSPIRVAIEGKKSKAGNTFYDFSMQGLALPDQLYTLLRVEGNLLSFGQVEKSQTGNPTRKSRGDIIIGGQIYIVEGHLTQGKTGYYVKVYAHKKPSLPTPKPRGGSFI